MEEITKIVIDLSAWGEHYPTGCILYNSERVIDSEYCDDAAEFIEFIEAYKELLIPYATDVRFVFDAYDLDNESAKECAKEVWNHVHDLIYKPKANK